MSRKEKFLILPLMTIDGILRNPVFMRVRKGMLLSLLPLIYIYLPLILSMVINGINGKKKFFPPGGKNG